MAITATEREEVISLLVGMFDAAPSAELLTIFIDRLEDGQTVTDIANSMEVTAEFESLYPAWLTDEEFARNFTTTILDGNTDSAGLDAGIAAVEDLLDSGLSRGETAKVAADFLMDLDTADATFGDAAAAFQNKVEVATYFATTMLNAESDLESLTEVLADVDESEESVSTQKGLIDLGVTSADGFDQFLTVDQDFLDGTGGDDTFAAYIFDNQNTAQSGDVVDGGAGFDTLFADIGNSQDFAITLHLDDVEAAFFRAQAASFDQSDNDIQDEGFSNFDILDPDFDITELFGDDGIDRSVQIDAERMNGTEQYWNSNSRANLTIEDIQRNSHEVTVGWRDSDAGQVNYEVYFDNITAPDSTTAGSQLFLELLDLDGMRTDNEPLLDNPYTGFQFLLGDEVIEITAQNPLNGAGATFQQLVDGFNFLLDEQGLDTVSAALGSTFTAINSKDGIAYEGTTIVLTNTGPETLGAVGWVVDGVLPPDSNVHTQIDDEPPATSNQLTQTDIIFDYVGSGSMSGAFVAGEISQGLKSGTPGIEQFNIDVDRTSSMTEIRTTNNTLEEIYVESLDGGADGTLTVNLIEDVLVFDASDMNNSVFIGATLGLQTTSPGELGENVDLYDKYFDLEDSAANETLDNAVFEYTLTGSDDSLRLQVAEEASAYEDFELEIDSGAGDDSVFLSFEDSGTGPNADSDLGGAGNWNPDQAALDNVIVSTGSGDDFVNTFGSGEVTITTGTGDDTVYTDNSGNTRATWVFNAGNTEVDNLLGNGNGNRYYLEDAELTVTFSGGNFSNGVTPDAADPLFNGWESTVAISTVNGVASEADISQAIKAAINDDRILGDLIVAEDGPNHSIIVTSLIDGVFDAFDLTITVEEGVFSTLNTTANQSNYQDLNNDSTVDFTAALLADEVEDLVTDYTGLDFDNLRGFGTADVNNQTLGSLSAGVSPEVPEVQIFDFAGVTLDSDDIITFTIDGDVTTTFQDDVTGAAADLGDVAAVAAIAADLGTVTINGTDYTFSVGATTTNLVMTQTAAAQPIIPASVSLTVDNNSGGAGDDDAGLGAPIAATNGTVGADTGADYAAAVGAFLTGSASDEGQNDNVINLGIGDDLVVLSTDGNSEEIIVITDTGFGTNTIVNFQDGNGLGYDSIDFSEFLIDIVTLPAGSTSTESQTEKTIDFDQVTVATGVDVEGSSVTVLDEFEEDEAEGETFDALTAADLLEAISEDVDAEDYGNIDEDTLDVVNENDDIVGSTRHHIVLVGNSDDNDNFASVNDTDDGVYKVFYLTSDNTDDNEFTSATLLGILDLGDVPTFAAENFIV